MKTESLVVALFKHRLFGWKFNVYVAERVSSECINVLGVPNAAFVEKTSIREKELIRLVEETSDKSLMKKYSTDNTTVEFLKHVTNERIEKFIRPAIEVYSSKIVALLLEMNYPLYFREELKNKMLYDSRKIGILPFRTRCIFNFEKNDDFRYFITLVNQDKEIPLLGKSCFVISEKPGIIVVEGQIHRLEDIESKKLTPFFDKKYIPIPVASEKKYIQDFVLKTFLQYDTKINGIEILQTKPEIKPVISIEKDWEGNFTLLVYFYYGTRKVNPSSLKKKTAWLEDSSSGYSIHWYERDFELENCLIDKFLSKGLLKKGDNRFYAPEASSSYELIEWLNKHREELNVFIIEQNLDNTFYIGDVRTFISLDTGIDWFEVYIQVIIGNFTYPFTAFRKNILSGNREFILPDKSVFILPEEWFSRYHELILHAEEHESNLRLKKIHFNLLGELDVNSPENKKVAAVNQPIQAIPLPGSLGKILRSYQKEGFYWLAHLHKNGFGGCLADDMGLGKTLQTIALMHYLYAYSSWKKIEDHQRQLSLFDEFESEIPPSLVVVPTSLIHNWLNEFKYFAPDLKIYVYAGTNRLKTKDIGRVFRHYHIILSSYGIIRNDTDFLKDYLFHYIVLDESQFVKNHDSQTYKAVKDLSSSHKLALTGTPIENSLSDLWAQFNFLNEGLLGNYSWFQKNYIRPIVKEKNKEKEVALQKLIQPFLLRRTKEEVTPELPPLSQQIIYCDMSEAQQEAYQKEKNSLRNRLFELDVNMLEKSKFVALQGLTKLRLLANHPLLTVSSYEGDSGKYDQIIMFFETLKAEGHKVLIFSSFVKHLELLAKEFEKYSWKYTLLTGQTRNREEEIRKFMENKDINCFFISLKAGGTGLNLTEADYVFIIDPWWNPAAEKQALSRAHRIGQKKNVMVYRFISTGTIEENMIRLQEKKRELSETFITSDNPLDFLTMQEIKELIEK